MQLAHVRRGGQLLALQLPAPQEEVLPGVKWGRADEVLSPAFWAVRGRADDAAQHGFANQTGTLAEEIGFCLLGGFGISAELATAYFFRLKADGVFERAHSHSEARLRRLLMEPVRLNDRLVRYRFPAQRARRLFEALPQVHSARFANAAASELKQRLLALKGIGPKTASWVIRNWFESDSVAILDVHVVRACQFCGVFPNEVSLPRQYGRLELQFINFAEALGVRPSILDAVIWSEMRLFSPALIRRLT